MRIEDRAKEIRLVCNMYWNMNTPAELSSQVAQYVEKEIAKEVIKELEELRENPPSVIHESINDRIEQLKKEG